MVLFWLKGPCKTIYFVVFGPDQRPPPTPQSGGDPWQALFLFSCKHLLSGNEENTSLILRIFVLNRCDLSLPYGLQSPPCPPLSLRSYIYSLKVKEAPFSGELPVFAQGDKGRPAWVKQLVSQRAWSPWGMFYRVKVKVAITNHWQTSWFRAVVRCEG